MATYQAGSRYDPTAVLLALQAPSSAPASARLGTVTSPIQPPPRSADVLAHFFEDLYNLRSESHLSRFLKVLLGDTGTGQLRKLYLTSRTHEGVLTTQFYDLDRIYGDVFGVQRLSFETLAFNPYTQTATAADWETAVARDSNYRARVVDFSRSLPLTGTPTGMAAATSALLGGIGVDIFESYEFLDSPGGIFGTYAGDALMFGRGGTVHNRGEVVVRPRRPITLEENYQLIRVLTRLKPANVLLTIDPNGVSIHQLLTLRSVAADSTYWEITSKVSAAHGIEFIYPRVGVAGAAVDQPRLPFSAYQGEAWSYNSDVSTTSSYAIDDQGNEISSQDYERRTVFGVAIDYLPSKALSDPTQILLGRYVSDGIMTTSPYSRTYS